MSTPSGRAFSMSWKKPCSPAFWMRGVARQSCAGGFAHACDRVLVAADVLEIGVEFRDAEPEGHVDLLHGAAEDGKLGFVHGHRVGSDAGQTRFDRGVMRSGAALAIGAAPSFSTSSRRSRFNSLTGTMTSPSR